LGGSPGKILPQEVGEFLGAKTVTTSPFASTAALRGPTWFILAFAKLSADAVREVTRR
jgi:hypothetical protein